MTYFSDGQTTIWTVTAKEDSFEDGHSHVSPMWLSVPAHSQAIPAKPERRLPTRLLLALCFVLSR